MKKKILIITLTTIIVLSLGVGVYALFSSALIAKSNEITTGKLSLNDKIDELEADYTFDQIEKIIPGESQNAGNWKITNTGTMDMKLTATVETSVIDRNNEIMELGEVKFEVNPILIVSGNTIDEDEFMPITDLQGWLNGKLENYIFSVGQVMSLQLEVKLNESAGNEYQESSLDFTITIEGMQTN